MFGVLAMTDGVDMGIHLFNTINEANNFILSTLVRKGVIELVVDGFKVGSVTYAMVEQAVEAAQLTFDALEFLHVYQVYDYRT